MGPGRFGVFNSQICIVQHSRNFFSHFLTSSSISKADENSKSHYISIFFMLLLPLQFAFLNPHERLFDLMRYSEWSMARKLYDKSAESG